MVEGPGDIIGGHGGVHVVVEPVEQVRPGEGGVAVVQLLDGKVNIGLQGVFRAAFELG